MSSIPKSAAVQTFFCPSMKLIVKDRVGSKTLKRHDSPKTPSQGIMESAHIGETVEKALTVHLKTLNPFVLGEAMESKLKEIYTAYYSYDQLSQRSLSSVAQHLLMSQQATSPI